MSKAKTGDTIAPEDAQRMAEVMHGAKWTPLQRQIAAGDLARINRIVRDTAAPRLTVFDVPADFRRVLRDEAK